MPDPVVLAPVCLLLEPELSAPAKVIWLAMRALAQAAPPPRATPTRLAAASGLSQPTIRKGLAQLTAAGWYSPSTGPIDSAAAAERVSIPVGLLSERGVRPQAKLLYGILQTLPAFRDRSGEFTYAALGASARLSAVTVRQVVQELAGAGWLQVSQAHQLAPIRFTLRIPELDRRAAEAAQARLRLVEAEFRGEEIMKEYLSLLIDSDEFEDNARPGFLVNPLTDERMELDRYYPPVVAFEFNGSQHYRTSKRFPSQRKLVMQQSRDLMKEALCARRGVRVVVIHPEDLTLERMQQKVGTMPLRDLRGHEELIQVLERAGRSYRE